MSIHGLGSVGPRAIVAKPEAAPTAGDRFVAELARKGSELGGASLPAAASAGQDRSSAVSSKPALNPEEKPEESIAAIAGVNPLMPFLLAELAKNWNKPTKEASEALSASVGTGAGNGGQQRQGQGDGRRDQGNSSAEDWAKFLTGAASILTQVISHSNADLASRTVSDRVRNEALSKRDSANALLKLLGDSPIAMERYLRESLTAMNNPEAVAPTVVPAGRLFRAS